MSFVGAGKARNGEARRGKDWRGRRVELGYVKDRYIPLWHSKAGVVSLCEARCVSVWSGRQGEFCYGQAGYAMLGQARCL